MLSSFHMKLPPKVGVVFWYFDRDGHQIFKNFIIQKERDSYFD